MIFLGWLQFYAGTESGLGSCQISCHGEWLNGDVVDGAQKKPENWFLNMCKSVAQTLHKLDYELWIQPGHWVLTLVKMNLKKWVLRCCSLWCTVLPFVTVRQSQSPSLLTKGVSDRNVCHWCSLSHWVYLQNKNLFLFPILGCSGKTNFILNC